MEILIGSGIGFVVSALASRWLHSAPEGSVRKKIAVVIFSGGGPGPIRQE
jgi:hypothetical protein